ncbi:protein SPT2 homolog isoform X1 [Eleutherodactylus coqui]|uniref:protein SPT2 homolog isoform X1 n=2 Tax=Eleutherodactylus coqui TaxID=57060 RepID=UPI0034635EE3
MDYLNVIKEAASRQSNDVAKRYSLAVGPPKKDPKVKGVQSAAVQAFLRRKEDEIRQKELREKRKKEDLLAKRKELKHDKKARAMASRTKDNFRGYNGIPMEEKPRKRSSMDQNDDNENREYLTEEEMYEYSQSESEQEEIEEPPPPPPPSKKPKLSNVKKAPPAAMNFNDLLRLAEKKQYEPVEILKPVKKNDERPRTAEELKEIEFLERKNHKPSKPNGQIVKVSKSSSEKHSSSKGSNSEDKKIKSSSSTSKSRPHDKAQSGENGPVKKHSDLKHKSEKHSSVSHSKTSKVPSHGNSKPSSSKELGAKPPSSRPDVNGKLQGSSRPSSTSFSSMKSSGASGKQLVSTKPSTTRPSGVSSSSRPSGASTCSSGRPSGAAVTPSSRPTSNSGSSKPSGSSVHPSGSSTRPSSKSGSVKPHSSSSSSRPSSSGNLTSSSGPARPSSISNRPATGNPLSASKPKSIPSGREGSSVRPNGGPTLSSSKLAANSGPGRPGNHSTMGSGSKPKCTVVSETISSKNFGSKSSNGPVNGVRPGQVTSMRPGQVNGVRPGQVTSMRPGQVNGVRTGQVNGMRPGPPPGYRPMARPPGPPLPPITSAYKRRLDDDEYDSEMEDFIDDGGEPQDEISKHIREIFGYDKNQYKDESDYALRYMESSFREQQKEEARSLRLGIQEDLEELRREEEELKRKANLEKANKKLKKR